MWPEDRDYEEAPLLRPTGPRVVAVGGGHGLSMVLSAARSYARQVVGIVTVADDGGSSGRLTSTLDIPPPGDMRRCLLALSPTETVWGQIFGYRFTDTDVAGHSMGNLILATLTQLTGDFETALGVAAGVLGAEGRILPVARQSLHLSAVIDGRPVDGQVEIARAHGTIESLTLTPELPANPHAIEAIRTADQIILGPGSLYTSVLSALLVPGMQEAIDAAPGRLLYALNLTTQEGETAGMSGLAHLAELLRFSGLGRGGTIVAHRRAFDAPAPVDALTIDDREAAALGWEVHRADLLDTGAEWPQHDPKVLEDVLAGLT